MLGRTVIRRDSEKKLRTTKSHDRQCPEGTLHIEEEEISIRKLDITSWW